MSRFRSAAFSLLELLIASALGASVVMGLMAVYLSIKTNYNRQQVISNLQDAGRFAQTILNQRIRTAGLVVCANTTNPIDSAQAIVGYNSVNVPGFLQGQVIPGTDAVVIKNCVAHSQIAQNAELVSMAYYIGDTNRKNSQGQPVLALFQKPSDGNREELVAGAEQMQIMYGLAADAGGDLIYYPAAQVGDWQAVKSVQIDLLLNSVDAVLAHPQAYYFHGQLIFPPDLLLHQAWSTTIDLREVQGGLKVDVNKF